MPLIETQLLRIWMGAAPIAARKAAAPCAGAEVEERYEGPGVGWPKR